MLQSVRAIVEPAALQRLTLLVNHVLSAEPVAAERMSPHAGKRLHIELSDWPSLLPAPPVVVFEVTPAGLFEWPGVAERANADIADLHLRVDAANPALLLVTLAAGERPDVEVRGEAQFAADVQWLADNLRWDLEADLARLLGPLPARQLARFGAALSAGLRQRVSPAAGRSEGPTAQ